MCRPIFYLCDFSLHAHFLRAGTRFENVLPECTQKGRDMGKQLGVV